MRQISDRELHEECGVFGVFGVPDAASLSYYGLHALQHRGQEGAGIVAVDEGGIFRRIKGSGLVTEVFDEAKLATLKGNTAIGHVRYTTAGGGGIENVGKEHFFSSEKLTTLLTLFKYYGEFENALTMMQAMFNVGGKGHSCGIYSFDDDHIHRLGMCAPVSRIMVRQPNNRGNSGSCTNGMPPTSSMGCGTWGGNSTTENVHWRHFINVTWVNEPVAPWTFTDEDMWGDFWKKYGK